MGRIYSRAARPVESNVAVAAAGIYNDGSHIGVLHRADPATPVKFLHLCDHLVLKNETPRLNMTAWIDPDIDSDVLELVTDWCRLIFDLHGSGKMPYGFSSPEAFFDDGGKIREEGIGLTCATLVLALFHQVGIKLIDYSTWPKLSREDKKAWKDMAEHIGGKHLDQYRKLETDATKSRYRPLHVAGAFSADATRRPVRFRSAIQLGGKVRRML
jgi:hypothetical protein